METHKNDEKIKRVENTKTLKIKMNRAKTWTNFLCFQLIRFFDLHTFFKWTNEIKFSWAVELQKNTHHTLYPRHKKLKKKKYSISNGF